MKYQFPYSDIPRDSYYDEFVHPETAAISEVYEGRGPHQNREFGLMLAGRKPMALLDDWQVEGAILADIVPKNWTLALFERGDFGLAIPGEEWRLYAMHRNFQRYAEDKISWELYTARMGVLLGYLKADIRGFVNDTLPRHIKSLSRVPMRRVA